MKLFKKTKWTKWMPITVYVYNFEDFVLLGRMDLESGNVEFQSKKVHGRKVYTQAYNLFKEPFDANKQLLELFQSKQAYYLQQPTKKRLNFNQ